MPFCWLFEKVEKSLAPRDYCASLIFTMLDILKRIDLFGQPVQLFYNQHREYKTLLGGIVTVLISTLSVVAFVYYSQQIVQHSLPNLMNVETITPNDFRLPLTNENLGLAFQVLQNDRPIALDPRLVYLTMSRVLQARQPDGSYQRRTDESQLLELCNSDEHFPNI